VERYLATMGRAKNLQDVENGGWRVLYRSPEIRCRMTGNALWVCQHTCGGEATLTSQQIKFPPKWCQICRPSGMKGGALGHRKHSRLNGVYSLTGCLYHICGCSSQSPCERALRLLLAKPYARQALLRHLEFTYRPEGTALHGDYMYPSIHPDDHV
jgi:hypothetical protein